MDDVGREREEEERIEPRVGVTLAGGGRPLSKDVTNHKTVPNVPFLKTSEICAGWL